VAEGPIAATTSTEISGFDGWKEEVPQKTVSSSFAV